MPKTNTNHVAKPGVFVALVYDALKLEHFDCVADLAEAVKCAAAKLHLSYDSRQITDAIAYVSRVSPRPLFGPAPAPLPPDRLVSDPPVVSRADAQRILAQLKTAAPQMPAPDPAEKRIDTNRLRLVLPAIEMLTTKG